MPENIVILSKNRLFLCRYDIIEEITIIYYANLFYLFIFLFTQKSINKLIKNLKRFLSTMSVPYFGRKFDKVKRSVTLNI